jgi:hypothetical protein
MALFDRLLKIETELLSNLVVARFDVSDFIDRRDGAGNLGFKRWLTFNHPSAIVRVRVQQTGIR